MNQCRFPGSAKPGSSFMPGQEQERAAGYWSSSEQRTYPSLEDVRAGTTSPPAALRRQALQGSASPVRKISAHREIIEGSRWQDMRHKDIGLCRQLMNEVEHTIGCLGTVVSATAESAMLQRGRMPGRERV